MQNVNAAWLYPVILGAGAPRRLLDPWPAGGCAVVTLVDRVGAGHVAGLAIMPSILIAVF